MKKIFFIIMILPLSLFGQDVTKDDLGTDNPELLAKKGTYEIIIDNSIANDILPITSSVLKTIELNRTDFDYTFINLAPGIIVKIYPRYTKLIIIKDEK